MSILQIILIAIGLAMDAFAVSLTCGLKLKKPPVKTASYIGLMFGFFQFFMPVLGFYATFFLISTFSSINIDTYSKYIAFILLALIGGKMLHEALSKKDEEENDEAFSISFKYLLPLAIATSIDAMSVGGSFALLNVEVFSASIIIGIITFIISTAGVFIGSKLGEKLQSKAEIFGGTILILIGLKILLF